MNLRIQVIKTTSETVPTAKGSYKKLEVVHKNLETGKVDSKKIMSFALKETFDVLENSKADEYYDIVSEKNEKTGYWDWTSAVLSTGAAAPSDAPASGVGSASVPKTNYAKNTYETPEERAQKQVYITRSWSVTTAISMLSIGAKKALEYDEVTELAKKLDCYVFGICDPVTAIKAMKNDLPQEPEVQ